MEVKITNANLVIANTIEHYQLINAHAILVIII